MKIEYDPVRDLLYLWFGTPGEKAAQTVIVVPGTHADFDSTGKLIGIEVLDASEILGEKLQVFGSTTYLEGQLHAIRERILICPFDYY